MSTRVRCTRCQTAFLTAVDGPGEVVECPKCGARHRLPRVGSDTTAAASEPPPPSNVFVPSGEAQVRKSRRWWLVSAVLLVLLTAAGLSALILWPRLKPRPVDPVERVSEAYMQALMKSDEPAQRRLSTIEEPPAIRSYARIRRDRGRDRTFKGTFAPLARLHARIASEFTYDPEITRFTPKNPLGAAGQTLDAVHAAKEKAEKSGIYEKMASGDPNDIFDAAENFGKVFSDLAEGALAPKKILPTYKMLVDDAKPPLPEAQQALAGDVAGDPKTWDALLKRPFHTLKADGPFVYERAVVNAEVTDQLASLGDPPSHLRLSLVRFRLEGIDTGWRIIAARRIQPGEPEEPPVQVPVPSSPGDTPPRSLGNPASAPDTR